MTPNQTAPIGYRTRNAQAACAALSALLLVVVTPLLPGPRAEAQFRLERRTDGSLVYARTESLEQEARWRGMTFPARTRRRAPRAVDRAHIDDRRARYAPIFAEAAALYRLPVAFLHAVAHVESSFDPTALSGDGAMGLMQLMPFTAREMGITDARDPRQNIFGGARFLRLLANQWRGNLVLTIAAYNAGSGAVRKYRGIPPFAETQRYVRRVLEYYWRYRPRQPS